MHGTKRPFRIRNEVRGLKNATMRARSRLLARVEASLVGSCVAQPASPPVDPLEAQNPIGSADGTHDDLSRIRVEHAG